MVGIGKDRMDFLKRYLAGLAGQGGWPDTHIFFLRALRQTISRRVGYRVCAAVL
jgi:hypothetical protein